MKVFHCQSCGQMVYFANTRCERCGHRLGYLPDLAVLSALAPLEGDRWRPLAAPTRPSRFCANAAHDACNWLIPAESPGAFCQACRLNRTIPDLGPWENRLRWQRLETAKHRLVYGLLRLGLPLVSRFDDPETGLAFDFLANSDRTDSDRIAREHFQIVTGHAAGLITIDIAEADDAERERHRRDMAESYRTLLGHFRHEVGHYYWDRLVRSSPWIAAFRDLFGDERRDYQTSLSTYYAQGPPAGWQQHHVSGYASAHPWEDFAETWAHYLHILDTLETACEFGLRVRPRGETDPALIVDVDFDPYGQQDFNVLIGTWLPLTYGVNSLNHSMGLPDLYPFVLAPTVMGKLRFVHGLVFPLSSALARPA
ncbi:putative zinc-binding peptidase [Azospirillum sp.]|uniref:zinc-binding metallopeptidase family protein n=1 Tax=Azospirillum sp. TaxID=34012 RepID=UPI002D21F4C4|nr:putative zinc-binding peptidase [Azospirillum sp.]HYD67122.1 putative zinc-binding peptidase [Azospirillum sp.]